MKPGDLVKAESSVRELFRIGETVDVQWPLEEQSRRGRIVGYGAAKNRNCVRVILDGRKTVYTAHVKFITKVQS